MEQIESFTEKSHNRAEISPSLIVWPPELQLPDSPWKFLQMLTFAEILNWTNIFFLGTGWLFNFGAQGNGGKGCGAQRIGRRDRRTQGCSQTESGKEFKLKVIDCKSKMGEETRLSPICGLLLEASTWMLLYLFIYLFWAISYLPYLDESWNSKLSSKGGRCG